MNPFQSFLHLLSDPNIAFILFTLGFYGIFFELQNPNYVTGILGAFALILAFIGFGSLPLNIAGLLLIGLAVVLFVLEWTVTSGGLLTDRRAGGLRPGRLCALHRAGRPGGTLGQRQHRGHRDHDRHHRPRSCWAILSVLMRQRRKPQTVIGVSHIDTPLVPLGTEGEVRGMLDPDGHGLRRRRGMDGSDTLTPPSLERGTPVRVSGNDGMVLIVERSRCGAT